MADDHTMIRQAIARSLADIDGFEIIGQASTAQEVLDLLTRDAPDVLLMDIGMPGTDGLTATAAIRNDFPRVAVLILTVHDREDYFFKALQAGASGYVLKGGDLDELIEAIRTVVSGSTYVAPSLMPKLVAGYVRLSQGGGAKSVELNDLSDREQEVLRLTAGGHTIKEIAEALTISPHTVRRHQDHIMSKLNLHSKAELILFAVRRGILDEQI